MNRERTWVCTRWRTFFVLCVVVTLVSGCLLTATPAPVLTPLTDTPPSPEETRAAATPTATAIPPGAPQTLTLWITEFVSSLNGDTKSQIFAQQISAFEATHPGLDIQVLHKQPEGKGGMQDFLSSASAVAPAVVPDLIVVDTDDLASLARDDLILPLDEQLSPALVADLYPFAIDACTTNGQLVGIQFETDIEHAIYNTSKIAVPPLSWTEVFSSGATYIFPTAGQEGLVNDAFLIQYLSTGAELVDDNGDPALDQKALTDVLEFYARGIEAGAILTDVLEYATVEQGWPKYLQAEVVMSNISAKLYLNGRGLLTVSEATMVPTRDGQQAIALSQGHAWALTSQDPNRQLLALKLLEWLASPGNMAAWSQAAERLPTRREAFEQMEREPYVAFAHNQLEYTIPYPSSDEVHQRIYRAMQQAVDDVLRKDMLPEVAAENVLKMVDQKVSP